jgi:hypothetical protein
VNAQPAAAVTPATVNETTPAQFAAKADAVCTVLHRHLKPLEDHIDHLDNLHAMAPYARKIVPLAAELTRRLAAIPKPAVNRNAYTAYIRLLRKQASEIRAISAAMDRGDVPTFTRLASRNSDYIARQHGLAQGLGLKVCGNLS